MEDLDIEHRDGVTPWYEAELPPRLHRCRWQTRGWLGYFTVIERCACGAVQYEGEGWFQRNSRPRPRRSFTEWLGHVLFEEDR